MPVPMVVVMAMMTVMMIAVMMVVAVTVPVMVVVTLVHPLREPFNREAARAALKTPASGTRPLRWQRRPMCLGHTLPTPLVQSPDDGSAAPPPMLNAA